MKTKKFVATVEQVGEVIRGIDLTPLENRLAGKSLIGMEHCLVEVLGYLSEDHRSFNKFTGELARDCIESSSRYEFLSAYAEYRQEKSRFGTDHNLASPGGYYFQALHDRLSSIKEKQERSGKTISVRHALTLVALVVREIELMWASSRRTNERVEQLWAHWVKQ